MWLGFSFWQFTGPWEMVFQWALIICSPLVEFSLRTKCLADIFTSSVKFHLFSSVFLYSLSLPFKCKLSINHEEGCLGSALLFSPPSQNAFHNQLGGADLLRLMTTTFSINLLTWFPQLSSYWMGFCSNLLIFEVSVIPSWNPLCAKD